MMRLQRNEIIRLKLGAALIEKKCTEGACRRMGQEDEGLYQQNRLSNGCVQFGPCRKQCRGGCALHEYDDMAEVALIFPSFAR